MGQTMLYCAGRLLLSQVQVQASYTCEPLGQLEVLPRGMSCKFKHSTIRPACVRSWASGAHTSPHCVVLFFWRALGPFKTQRCYPALPFVVQRYSTRWCRYELWGWVHQEHPIIQNMNHIHLCGGEEAVSFMNSVLWLIYSNINTPGEVDQNILWIYKYSCTNICHSCIAIILFSWEEKSLFEEGPM